MQLPRHPGLLRQLSHLQYETTETGVTRISVHEAGGQHDDLAMALCLAATGIAERVARAPVHITDDALRAPAVREWDDDYNPAAHSGVHGLRVFGTGNVDNSRWRWATDRDGLKRVDRHTGKRWKPSWEWEN